MLPTQELAVRVLVLCVYIVAAVGVAWIHREALAAVIHLTGAVAALCAVSLAVTYAGLVGEASPGPVEDQARDYMERTEWDD